MKKLLLLALLAISPTTWAAVNVFACEPEWAALASEIGGDLVKPYSATTALQDPHKIQARPSLIAAYRRADLLVCTGAELELGWLPALAQKGNNPKLRAGTPGHLEVSQSVTMLEVPATVDRSQGDVHPYGNPHIQSDPHNILAAAEELANRLSQVDPEHADDYATRFKDFQKRWKAAMTEWETRAAPLKGIGAISSHNGFPYLYNWLGMRRLDTLEATPGVPPSAGHLQSVLAGLKTQPARMVIYAAYQNSRPAEWLSEHGHIPAVKLPFTVGGVKGTNDLFSLFDVTINRLLEAAS